MSLRDTAPGGTGQSPTGYAWLPQWAVKALLVLALLATAWQAAELYDFKGGTWHPERVPIFILSITATAGIASQGVRKLVAVAFLAGGVLFAAPTWASDRAIYEPAQHAGLASTPPSIGDIVDLATGPGLDVRAGQWSLGVTVLGTVALVDVTPRWTLSAAMGGALLAPLDAGEPAAVAKAGLTLQLPGQTVRPSVGAGATYFVQEKRWGAWLALLFHL